MNMVQKRFGRQNWWILVIFGLIGQIAWSVENMYFNLFVYETIDKKRLIKTWTRSRLWCSCRGLPQR